MPVSGLLCAQAQYVVRKCALNPPLTLISRSVDLSGWTDPKSGRPAYAGFAYRGLGRDDVPVVLSCGRPSNKIDIPTMLSDVRSAAASGWRTEVGRIGCYSREHRRGVVDQLPAGPYQISCAVLTTYTTESGGSVEAGSPAWIDITRRHPYYRIILGE